MLTSGVPLEVEVGSIILKAPSRSAANNPDYVIITEDDVHDIIFEINDECKQKTQSSGVVVGTHRGSKTLVIEKAADHIYKTMISRATVGDINGSGLN